MRKTDRSNRKKVARLTRRRFARACATVVGVGIGLPLLLRTALAAQNTVALVHTQAAGDSGPVDGMIEKLKELSRERRFDTRIIYARDPAGYEATLRMLAAAGVGTIVATFAGMAAPVMRVARQFPRVRFIHIFADPVRPALANLATVSYSFYQGCYLSGLFGARFSRSKKLGYVGGVNLPAQIADLNAIRLAASSVDRAVTVTAAFAGSFQDPAKGREIATHLYESGVDYVQTDGAATDVGVVRASMGRSAVVVSAISRAHMAMSPRTVIAIVLIDFGRSVYEQVSASMAAGWAGGHHASGLGDGVIDFLLSERFLAQGDAG
ncbi:MAG: BMP family ABC transporter substrate-binding protein, partial [Tepidisphaeraceae bacterium]